MKAFLLRGNVVDLTLAVIIGAAFGAIVTSLVNDIILLILNLSFEAAGDKIAELSWNGVLVRSNQLHRHWNCSLQLSLKLLKKHKTLVKRRSC